MSSHVCTNGSADEIVYNQAAFDDLGEWTAALWIYLTATGNFRRILNKDVSGGGTGFRNTLFFGNQLFLRVDYSTQQLDCNTQANAYDTNAWNYMVFSFDEGASAGNHGKMFKGDLSTVVTELTLGSHTDPEGLREDDSAANVSLGAFPGSSNSSAGFRVASFQFWNERKSEEFLRIAQRNPFAANDSTCIELAFPGLDEVTNAVYDLSGNANHASSLTGISLENGLPQALPWSPPSYLFAPAAPSTGITAPKLVGSRGRLAGIGGLAG